MGAAALFVSDALFVQPLEVTSSCPVLVEMGLVFMQNLLVFLLPHICIAAASSGFIPEALHLYSLIIKVSDS